jgi:hypothetical protein
VVIPSVRAALTVALIGLLPHAALSGQNTGSVTAVNINRVFNGLAVQLNVPTTAIYESACPWGNWVYLPQSDPFYASILAVLMAAKASGETLVVASGGCVQSPYGLLPVIATVDYGIRVGP